MQSKFQTIEWIEGDETSYIHLFKENNQRFMVLLSSNAYLDREEEIVKQKALERHVKTFDSETFHPLLLWHGGEPIGQIIEAQMTGPFLFELAKELPNKIIDLAREEGEEPFFISRRAVWDTIEETPKRWGVSIGFKHEQGDEKDGAFDVIFKTESSILPHEDAANAVTLSQIIRS